MSLADAERLFWPETYQELVQELHRTFLRFSMENPPQATRPVHDHDLDWLVRRTKLSIGVINATIQLLSKRIGIMEAFLRGDKIEERCLNDPFPANQWHPCETPGWFWDTNDYRVAKPAELIWRLLNFGEIIEKGDEVFNSLRVWTPVSAFDIGQPVNSGPVVRRINLPTESHVG